MKFQRLDSWSFVHIFGSFFLVKLILHLNPVVWQAALIAFGLGLCWEGFDQFFGKGCGVVWFDSRGFDGSDVLMDALGCALALWI